MRRSRIGLLLLVLALVAPATGRAADTSARPSSREHRTPAQRYRAAVTSGKATLQELLMLRYEMWTSPVFNGGSGLIIPATRMKGAAPATEEPPPSDGDGAYVFALAAEDLDDRTGDEVVTLISDQNIDCRPCLPLLATYYETMSVRDGATGEKRWSVEVANLQGILLADLSGDGRPEVITVEQRAFGDVTGLLLAFGGAVVERTTIRVRDGVDGSLRWERTTTGTYAVAVGYAIVSFAEVLGQHGVVVSIEPTSDADGDGAPDLLVQRSTAGLAYAIALVAGGGAVPARSVGYTYSGADGTDVAKVAASGAYVLGCALLCVAGGDLPWIVSAGDVSGDGLADVFALEPAPAVTRVGAKTSDGSRVWTYRTVSLGDFEIGAANLTGDARKDLLLTSDRGDLDRALEGGTGTLLWEFAGSYTDNVRNVGDVDGDGGDDLSYSQWTYSFETDTEVLSKVVVSGASGRQIWKADVVPRQTPQNQRQYVSLDDCWGCPVLDLDGDGVGDALFFEYMDEEPDWGTCDRCDYRLIGAHVTALDGRDGSTLWSSDVITEWEDIPWYANGDLNGNGTSDLVTLDRAATSVTMNFIEGGSLDAISSVTLAFSGGEQWIYEPIAGNLDGSPGDELALTVEQWQICSDLGCDGEYDITTHAVAAGGELWRL